MIRLGRSRLVVGAAAAIVVTAALAKMWGPFQVAAAGPDYVSTTLGMDSETEYSAAEKIAGIYLSPVLNTPAAIQKAIKDDFIRIVYYDGQIADFKIRRWPSTVPVDFIETVPTVDTKRLTESQLEEVDRRNNSCLVNVYTFSLPTGYWGVSYDYADPPAEGMLPTLIISTSWVSTGDQVFTINPQMRCQYR
jgi:hypothetical protein